jgi:hypothetical protein
MLSGCAVRPLRGHRFTTERARAIPKLIYAAITSLGGYVEDIAGKFDWAAPDEQ